MLAYTFYPTHPPTHPLSSYVPNKRLMIGPVALSLGMSMGLPMMICVRGERWVGGWERKVGGRMGTGRWVDGRIAF